MGTYEVNREFSDKHLPQVKVIIAEEIITFAPFVDDTQKATDLVVLSIPRGQIAVRLRRHGYANLYPWEFTIRFRTGNYNYNTEFKKIVDDGWADLFFYGHLNNEGIINRWFLIDLDNFRNELNKYPRIKGNALQNYIRTNNDLERTQLIAFDVRWFSSELIIKSSHSVPDRSEFNYLRTMIK